MSPHLTGEHTLGELCTGLPPEQRATITHLIEMLMDRGFVRDRAGAGEVDLDDAVRVRFAPQLNFVEHYVDDAAGRFTAFRETTMVVMGDGPVARSAALCSLRNGVRTLHLVDAGASLAGEVEGCAAELRSSGLPSEVRAGMPPDAADVVIAAVAELGPTRFGGLVADLPDGTVLLPVLEAAGCAFVGPATRRTGQPCWTCMLLRLEVNLPARAAANVWRGLARGADPSPSTRMSTPVARMLGTTLAFDAFRIRTACAPAETDSSVLVVDLDTLTSTRERLLPHPACPACGGREPIDVDPGVDHPIDAELSEREVHDRYWSHVAPYVGVFSGFHDDDLKQSPLKTARIRLGSADRDAGDGIEITAFDVTSVLAARNRAFRVAATVYADVVGGRGPGRGSVESSRGIGAVAPPESISTWTGLPVPADHDLAWTTASAVLDGTEWLVPTAAVRRSAMVEDPLFERLAVGAGAGTTMAEAVDEGLRSVFAHRALSRALAGVPATEAAPELLASDPEVALLYRVARHLGFSVQVLRLPADGLAEVVLATARPDAAGPVTGSADGRAVWLVRAGWSLEQAAGTALRDVVGRLQLGVGSAVDLGDLLVADAAPDVIRVATAPHRAESSPVRWPDRAGLIGVEPLVVDTTPPDLRTILRTVRVVLHSRERT
ncbi:TOMM precursor leader peptide-binding protein [Pseudonocardia sp.]|uniref:TOMM precursor leader peptide-binding protein n=1 Tax=Pseudonocardia sp. TaxID=60912 RepID=UPI00261DDA17|nr:TOMM precursor leader peptide-binding protein [Pseudonocardia sp.]